jgi:hypothetical protein
VVVIPLVIYKVRFSYFHFLKYSQLVTKVSAGSLELKERIKIVEFS